MEEDGILPNIENFLFSEEGVRPSISLKLGFNLTGNGDGSATNPYVVN